MANDAVGQVRREEQHHNGGLKNTRYVWLKDPEMTFHWLKKKIRAASSPPFRP
jgi:hypothetical protein